MDNYSGNKEYNIYRDIRNRTNGEIYLGIVGSGCAPENPPSSNGLWS